MEFAHMEAGLPDGFADTCPEGPAVYFLLVNGEVVYVGASIRPAKRVATHRYPIGRKFDAVMYLPTPADRLDEVERDWIRRLFPKHNKRDNPHPDPTAISWGEHEGDNYPSYRFDTDPMVFATFRVGGPKMLGAYREKHGVFPDLTSRCKVCFRAVEAMEMKLRKAANRAA